MANPCEILNFIAKNWSLMGTLSIIVIFYTVLLWPRKKKQFKLDFNIQVFEKNNEEKISQDKIHIVNNNEI